MKLIYKLLFIGFLFSICNVSYARTFSGKIIDMVTWSDGHTAIKIENGPNNGCSQIQYYSLGVKGQDPKAEPMLSVALAAYMAGRSVQVSTTDGVCQGGQEKITQLKLLP